jgi:threonine synthase
MSNDDRSITYSSTRGCPTQKHLSFRTVVMRGLAHDRGLFVPDNFPVVTRDELHSWRSLSYSRLAVEVISKFVMDDEVPRDVLVDIVERSCDAFRSDDVTPLIKVDGHYVLVSFIVISFVRCLWRVSNIARSERERAWGSG